MKEIVHTGKWHEPIVVTIRFGVHSHQRNLLVGEHISCEDDQISREMMVLERKSYVAINQLTTASVPMQTTDMSPEEIAKLEEELLTDDGSDAVSHEEQ